MSTVVVLLVGVAVGGVLGALGLAWARRRPVSTDAVPADLHHVVELVRRAHGAAASCIVRQDGDTVWSKAEPAPPAQALKDAEAAAKQALADGKEHVVRQGNTIISIGDGRLGSAVLFDTAGVDPDVAHRALHDLRRVLAEFHISRRRESGALETPTVTADWLTPDTVKGIGAGLLEAVRNLTSRPAALVVRDPATNLASITAVSAGADRRLLGMTISPASVAGRACVANLAAAGGGGNLLGTERQNRRQREDEGIAYSLRDGSQSVGALVLFCTIDMLSDELSTEVKRLVDEAGPLLGRAAAVHAEKLRASTDPLTGQPNVRALEADLQDYVGGDCSLVSVEIDQLADLDPPAAGAAVQHVARIFREILRDYDVAARVAENEFALFLPDTPSYSALAVADRIRLALSESALDWGGERHFLTCSFGVASVPDSATTTEVLLQAANTARTLAMREGPNQILTAEPLTN